MNKLYEESAIQDIANAIRSKSGTSDTFKVAEMGDAVRAIPQGGVTPTGTINISENGTFDVTQYATADVNVQGGGGLPSWIKYGEFELESDNTGTPIPISVDFGAMPSAIVFQWKDWGNFPQENACVEEYWVGGGTTNQNTNWTHTTSALSYNANPLISDVSANGFSVKGRSASYPLRTGTYRWLAIVVETE